MSASLDWHTYSIESLYDSIGQKYEIAFADIPAQTRSLEWLLSCLPHHGSKILDIGCGTGRPVMSTLAASPHHHQVHGIDISENMLSACRSAIPTATVEKIDYRDYQANPNTFDAITCYFALLVAMSQEEIKQTLRNIFEWLKPGGLFVLGTVPVCVEHFESTWLGYKGVFTSFTEEQYITLLKDLGFIVEFSEVEKFTPKGEEAGICKAVESEAEEQLFVYARKPLE